MCGEGLQIDGIGCEYLYDIVTGTHSFSRECNRRIDHGGRRHGRTQLHHTIGADAVEFVINGDEPVRVRRLRIGAPPSRLTTHGRRHHSPTIGRSDRLNHHRALPITGARGQQRAYRLVVQHQMPNRRPHDHADAQRPTPTLAASIST